MGLGRRILKRREFIWTGILGSAAISLPLSRLFSSMGVLSGPGKGKMVNTIGEAHDRIYDIVRKYSSEFGAVKPVIRRHPNGRL
jgi:hypothetical protein